MARFGWIVALIAGLTAGAGSAATYRGVWDVSYHYEGVFQTTMGDLPDGLVRNIRLDATIVGQKNENYPKKIEILEIIDLQPTTIHWGRSPWYGNQMAKWRFQIAPGSYFLVDGTDASFMLKENVSYFLNNGGEMVGDEQSLLYFGVNYLKKFGPYDPENGGRGAFEAYSFWPSYFSGSFTTPFDPDRLTVRLHGEDGNAPVDAGPIPTPLPAALPSLALGIGALALLRRRCRAAVAAAPQDGG